MKIALFADNFLPGTGGTENVVYRLGVELAKEHEVAVFAPDYHRDFDDEQFPFKVYRAKSLKITNSDFWAMPSVSKKTKRAIEAFKPDVVHSHTQGMMAEFANNYAKKHNIPSICTSHTNYKYCYKSAIGIPFIVNMVLRRVVRRLKNADKACTVSNFMASELKDYGLKKQVTIIKNGHNLVGIKEKTQNNNQKFELLFVGLIIDYKNIGFSLDVMKQLKKTRNDFVFNIVGDGPHRKRFEKYAKRIGVSENVVFHGRITDKEKLFALYKKADLMLFTSVIDTDGLVLLEAGEAGTPSLVIENTGASERYQNNVNGFIEKYSAESVAQRISALIDDREKVFEVGKRATEVFSPWSQIAKQYIDIYNEEIAKKK